MRFFLLFTTTLLVVSNSSPLFDMSKERQDMINAGISPETADGLIAMTTKSTMSHIQDFLSMNPEKMGTSLLEMASETAEYMQTRPEKDQVAYEKYSQQKAMQTLFQLGNNSNNSPHPS